MTKYILFFTILSQHLFAQTIIGSIKEQVKQEYPSLEKIYIDFHQNPELSFHEKETSAKMAKELKSLGFEVTENVGGYGIVGVLKNGKGATILVRADTDALPVEEKTGLSYSSKKKMKDDTGQETPVMHACGHDIHSTVWIGTARVLAKNKKYWKGTLVMIAQPAEERGNGAKKMLADGLFKRFPKPDACIALHCSASLMAGTVGYCKGYALASVDMVDITVFGKGGHGAYPHTTIDPILLAARLVVDLQTIVSRETPPTEPNVVTVGAIHGGTKHNIIPDEVKLQLTLRSYSDAVRQHNLDAIKRISKGIAISAGLSEDKHPHIHVADESIPATYNTPELTESIMKSFAKIIGDNNVKEVSAVMGGEDFGLFGRTEENIPISLYWLGTVAPDIFKKSQATGETLPSLHSPFFAPLPEPTIQTGVQTMSIAVIDLFNK